MTNNLWKYYCVTFLILLVPHMQAQLENVTKLLNEIDEFYGKSDCPEGLLKPIFVDLNEVERNPIPNLDFETHVNAYARYELLNMLLEDPVFAKRCRNLGSSKEQFPRARTLGLTSELLRVKLCITIHYRCRLPRPWEGPMPDFRPSQDNVQYRTTISPVPVPVPDQTYATCSPFDQHILLPNGIVEKRQQFQCVYPNQTRIIVPILQVEKTPIQSPSPGGCPSGPGGCPSCPGGCPSGPGRPIGQPFININQSNSVNVG